MQLTSISQVKVGLTVYHAYFGKGIATRIYGHTGAIRVIFEEEDTKCSAAHFYDDNHQMHISHLYTEPVYICERVQYKYGNSGVESHYYPIKPETK